VTVNRDLEVEVEIEVEIEVEVEVEIEVEIEIENQGFPCVDPPVPGSFRSNIRLWGSCFLCTS